MEAFRNMDLKFYTKKILRLIINMLNFLVLFFLLSFNDILFDEKKKVNISIYYEILHEKYTRLDHQYTLFYRE